LKVARLGVVVLIPKPARARRHLTAFIVELSFSVIFRQCSIGARISMPEADLCGRATGRAAVKRASNAWDINGAD